MDKLQQLLDLEEIRALKNQYSYGANIIDGKAGDLDMFAGLYVADATFDVGMGVAHGPAEIKAMMEQLTTQWHAAMHYMLNPLVELDGDRATAVVTGLFAFTREEGGTPIWLSNIYNDSFVRTPDGWRFQSVKVVQTAFVDPAFLEGYADHLA